MRFDVHSADRGISPVADGMGRRHWIGIASFLIAMTLIGIWCFRHGRAHSRDRATLIASAPRSGQHDQTVVAHRSALRGRI